jgi:hypothetical protein
MAAQDAVEHRVGPPRDAENLEHRLRAHRHVIADEFAKRAFGAPLVRQKPSFDNDPRGHRHHQVKRRHR